MVDDDQSPRVRIFHSSAVCRGAWSLGSACGHCERCMENAKPYIATLRDRMAVVDRQNEDLQAANNRLLDRAREAELRNSTVARETCLAILEFLREATEQYAAKA